MNPRRLVCLLVLLLTSALHLGAQVVQVSGYGSSVDGTEGASVALYGDNNTSRLSLGDAQGVHVGVSREVVSGPAHLTLGDSRPSLALPSDTDDSNRSVFARGALLQVGSADRNVTMFAGKSGENYGNSYFSSVSGEQCLMFSSATVRTGRVVWHSLMLHGERKANITSAQWRIAPHSTLSLSAGRNAGHPVFRATFHHEGKSWRLDVNDTSGHLQLQPQRALQYQQLERIGLNVSASKRLRQWLTVDAARHEYATGVTDLPDAPSTAMGARSALLEAGANVRFGEFQGGARLLRSSSGSAHDHATAWIAGWHRGDASATAMLLRRTDPQGVATTTLQLDAGHRVYRHLQAQSGLLLGNGNPHVDVGGRFEGNWGSLTVSHGETYIPFGPASGFKRVLSVAVHVHARNAEVGLARLSATGIPGVWQGSVNDFEGSGEGSSAGTAHPMRSMPKYRVEGTVMEGSRPVAGAAVAVGPQIVYTDSDGHWMARTEHNTAVRVVVQPGDFLTTERYRAATAARMETPAREATLLALQVTRVHAVELPHAAEVTPLEEHETASPRHALLHTLGRFAVQVVHVWWRKPPA